MLLVHSSRSLLGIGSESPPWLPGLWAWSVFLSYCSHQLCTSFQFFSLCSYSLYVLLPLWASVYFTAVRSLDFILNATGSHWRVWTRYNSIYILKNLFVCCSVGKRLEGPRAEAGKAARVNFNSRGDVLVIWIHPMEMEKTEFRTYSGGKNKRTC